MYNMQLHKQVWWWLMGWNRWNFLKLLDHFKPPLSTTRFKCYAVYVSNNEEETNWRRCNIDNQIAHWNRHFLGHDQSSDGQSKEQKVKKYKYSFCCYYMQINCACVQQQFFLNHSIREVGILQALLFTFCLLEFGCFLFLFIHE